MAAVPVEFTGLMYDLTGRTQQRVYMQGKMNIYGLSVGGGPIVPPDEVPPGQPPGIWGPTDPRPTPPIHMPQPPGIWGPTDPRPTPPIHLPPVHPGDPPLVIWGPNDPRPTPPIYLPPAPPDVSPAPPDIAIKPPPAEGGWAYVSPWGWGYFPKEGDSGPKHGR